MKNSLRLAILSFAILIMGMLSMSIAYGQTRGSITATTRTGPTSTWAPEQITRPVPAWSGIYFNPFHQRQLSPLRPYSILPQHRLTTYRTLLLSNGSVIRIR